MEANSGKATNRIQSIDFLRGLVMVIMALDHTRDYFHLYHKTGKDALDFGTTDELIFMTRWITHFCAPVFVFLAGTSIFLYNSHGKTKNETALFLITRGLWLIFCEFTIVGFAWTFSLFVQRLLLGVIWVIGLSMAEMSIQIYLPKKILFALGLIIIFGHNFLDGFPGDSLLWSMIHEPREFVISGRRVVALYSFLPWLGLMITGYFFGNLYNPDFDKQKRKKILIIAGTVSILLFIILRAANSYGDMSHWHTQKNFIFTVMSFVNTTKYPPSLLFLLMTIGPGLLILAFTENISNAFARVIIVYGRVPFFYYILHLYFIQTAIWISYLLSGHSINEMNFLSKGFNTPWGLGYSLGVVYAVWMGIVILLYFPCKWWGNYKSKHKSPWLSYV
jgi:uncharacterized membrane protein